MASKEDMKRALEQRDFWKKEEMEEQAQGKGEVDELFVQAVRLWLSDPSIRGTSSSKAKAMDTVNCLGLAKAFALLCADLRFSKEIQKSG
ncbi:MAG: hypothetical protein LBC69_00240 [Eubacteriaceae bacterium]|nr:hypothetical protein [Eubacteriaceae bacterium]